MKPNSFIHEISGFIAIFASLILGVSGIAAPSLESAVQQVQSYYLSQNLEKAKEGERSGAVSTAGRIPLSVVALGSGVYLGRAFHLRAGEQSQLTVKPSLRERTGELRFQSRESFSEFTQAESESRVGVGQNLPHVAAQTKVVYLPQMQDLRAVVTKSMTPHLSVEAEKSMQSNFESFSIRYNYHF